MLSMFGLWTPKRLLLLNSIMLPGWFLAGCGPESSRIGDEMEEADDAKRLILCDVIPDCSKTILGT